MANKREPTTYEKRPLRCIIVTYGCQMNEYDSEIIQAVLRCEGYLFVDSEIEADIILLNTCAVREHAQRKVFGMIHEIRHRREGKEAFFGVLGCIATHLKEEILNDPKNYVDFIAGPDSYKRLPDIIGEAVRTHKKTLDIDLSEYETYAEISPQRVKGVNAWIAVMRGCNNFCTFCVVPYTRGRERNRSPEDIIKEARQIAQDEYKQITLLGQNVNSYKYENADFADLLNQISQINKIKRIRFTSPHPKDFPDKLLFTIRDNKKICNQIHFPLQAGNDRILKLMNRSYTRTDFLAAISKMRKEIPNIVITTDIIIGFPTETDQEFEDTVKVIREAQFDSAFIFKYSERPGTLAAKKYPDDVPADVKTERIVRLNELQRDISLNKNQAHIGQVHEVLIESQGTAKSDKEWQGRNEGGKIVILPPGPYAPGQLVQAKITAATPHVLKGNGI